MKRHPSRSSFDVIPRSILWRFLLGLLEDMSDVDASNIQMHQQRTTYEDLVNQYYHSSTALAIICDTEKEPCPSSDKIKQSSSTPLKVYDDPLSIIMTIEETKLKIENEREVARKKERTLTLRSNLTDKSESPRKPKDPLTLTTEKRWNDFYTSKEIMDLIEKDLDRLPLSHHIYFHQMRTGNIISNDEGYAISDDAMLSRQKRSKILAELLFVYAKKNSNLGYRQGMHEILSLVLVVVEQDLLLKKKSEHWSDYHNLLDDQYKSHDSYSLFEGIMEKLGETFESRIEYRGSNVLNIIKEWYGHEELADVIEGLDVPTEVYCTRWTRLMFSREIIGLDSVFELWDELFHQAAIDHDNDSFLRVLETASASMIILIEPRLTSRNSCSYGNTNRRDENEVIHLLMNYPRIDDVGGLIDTLKTLLEAQRLGVKPTKIRSECPKNECNHYYPQHDYLNADVQHMHPNLLLNQESTKNNRQTDAINKIGRLSQSDPIRITLQNIKEGHAWEKVSNGLKDAWQSFDTKLQTIASSNGMPGKMQPNDFYDDKDDNNDLDQNCLQDHFEYRDLSRTPLLFRDHSFTQAVEIENQVIDEDVFVGGSNINREEKNTDLFSRIDSSLEEIGSFILECGQNAPMNVLNAFDDLKNLCDELKLKNQL